MFVAVIAATPASAEKRQFTMLAVEPKGGATVDKEPYPTATLPEGGGLVRKHPDHTGRWEVSAYVWQPSQLIVTEGDEVTIDFVGINGASHPAKIAGYDKAFVVKRGETLRVSFTANKAGVFPITCDTHKPSMTGELVVMPKR